jgi:hypothetical protein
MVGLHLIHLYLQLLLFLLCPKPSLLQCSILLSQIFHPMLQIPYLLLQQNGIFLIYRIILFCSGGMVYLDEAATISECVVIALGVVLLVSGLLYERGGMIAQLYTCVRV